MRRQISSNSGEMLKSIISSLTGFDCAESKLADCSRKETHSPATNDSEKITAPALFSLNLQRQVGALGWERCLLRTPASLEDLIDESTCASLPTGDRGHAVS